ncbi:hypothetical protein HanHA300_Chr06g0217801 [Helianthus annuus]|nr:hypothetical protein HanHA300_Chr06g0217801 [Helianthus annuus]
MRVIYESSSDRVRVKPVAGFHMNGSHGLNAWVARVLPLEWKTLTLRCTMGCNGSLG